MENIFRKYNINNNWQIYNFDESGYSPGRESNGKITEKFISKSRCRVDIPKLSFTYHNTVTILGCVSADESSHCLCIVLKGQNKSIPHVHGTPTKASEIMGEIGQYIQEKSWLAWILLYFYGGKNFLFLVFERKYLWIHG